MLARRWMSPLDSKLRIANIPLKLAYVSALMLTLFLVIASFHANYEATASTSDNCDLKHDFRQSQSKLAAAYNPYWNFSTFLGGGGDDWAWASGIDSVGNIVVVGGTGGRGFPTTTGAFQTVHKGAADAFVAKFTPDFQTLIFSTLIGGEGQDYPYDIAICEDDSIVIMGETISSDFPTTSGVFQDEDIGGAGSAFVSKFSSNGSIIFSTLLGGSGWEYARNGWLDGEGNIVISGPTWSTDFPTTDNAFQSDNGGSVDSFVCKLNSDGTDLLFSTYLGGSSSDGESYVTLNSQGEIIVSGYTSSDDFPVTANAIQDTTKGKKDAFVAILDPEGNMLYSTFLGGVDEDLAIDLKCDSEDNIWVSGRTESLDFPITLDGLQQSLKGEYDLFFVKLSPDGESLLYSTYFGGSGFDNPYSVDLDTFDNPVFTGYTDSVDFPLSSNAYQTHSGHNDVFVSMLDNTGSSLLFSTYIGGPEDDEADFVIIDDDLGYVIITGGTDSGDYPITNAFESAHSGGTDCFISCFSVYPEETMTTSFAMVDDPPANSAIPLDLGALFVGATFVAVVNINFRRRKK